MGKELLDASGDRVEGCQFKGIVSLIKALAGFAGGTCSADVMQSERLGLCQQIGTFARVVFIFIHCKNITF